ncbi:MAG: CaiB/BaiF CoA-transferase family protein [Myxococcota bacterium]
MSGPLAGIRIIEIEGIGPCPFAGMMLADLGAEVIRVGRPQPSHLQAAFDLMSRGKKSIVLDLKAESGVAALLEILKTADALIEGFRPGVMERLGIGPEACHAVNPRLVFGRMTGWGQEGPYAKAAGHDINYIALAGALHAIGRKGERPTVPLNLVGDFGGGGLLLAYGVLAALLETKASGQGQVVDAAMVDGIAALMSSVFAGMQQGFWSHERGENLLDSGAAFYDTYRTSDGKYISIGSLEPQFYAELIQLLDIKDAPAPMQHLQPAQWNSLRPTLEEIFASKTRDQWCEVLEGTDVCFAPVLTAHEAFEHPHHVARESFFTMDGVKQPVPAPRFSRTVPDTPGPARERGSDTEAILRECGIALPTTED